MNGQAQNDAPRRSRPDLKGWKEIAARLDVSVDTAMRYYRLENDHLPVIKDRFGRPMAHSSAIDAWLDRFEMPGRVYDEVQRLKKKLDAATRANVRQSSTKRREKGREKVA